MATKKSSGSRKVADRSTERAAPSPSSPAARAASSAKGTMSGPSAKRPLSPRRGVVERTATALGSGTGSDSDAVRRASVTERLQAKLDATEELSRGVPANPTKPSEYALGETTSPPTGEHSLPGNLNDGKHDHREQRRRQDRPKSDAGCKPQHRTARQTSR